MISRRGFSPSLLAQFLRQLDSSSLWFNVAVQVESVGGRLQRCSRRRAIRRSMALRDIATQRIEAHECRPAAERLTRFLSNLPTTMRLVGPRMDASGRLTHLA